MVQVPRAAAPRWWVICSSSAGSSGVASAKARAASKSPTIRSTPCPSEARRCSSRDHERGSGSRQREVWPAGQETEGPRARSVARGHGGCTTRRRWVGKRGRPMGSMLRVVLSLGVVLVLAPGCAFDDVGDVETQSEVDDAEGADDAADDADDADDAADA